MIATVVMLSVVGIFPHDTHFKEEISCDVCHENALTSTQSTDILLPETDLCLDCHDTVKQYTGPKVRKPIWIAKFPHKVHKSVDCVDCHKSATMPALPKMETCAGCHDDVTAPADCFICHRKDEDRLRIYHPPRWRSIHGLFAKTDESSCMICHRENLKVRSASPATACSECHVQEDFALQHHPENYEFQHPQSFFSREEDCATCHEGLQTCRDCHESEHIYPADHNQINWALQTSPGGLHREAAENDPERCLSCHEPADALCIQCHER